MRNLATPTFGAEAAGDCLPQLVHNAKQLGHADEIRPPRPDEHWGTTTCGDRLSAEKLIVVLTMAMGLALVLSFYSLRKPVVLSALVDRIIAVESSGDPNARNKRSSATGVGQFLEDTWLEAIRKHRRDLTRGRSDIDILELRRDAELAREMIARVLEQYAAMLNKRGLPITPVVSCIFCRTGRRSGPPNRRRQSGGGLPDGLRPT